MDYRDIMSYLNSNSYMDARIKVLNCNFFGDEVVLIHEYKKGNDVKLSFLGCCKVLFQNDPDFEKEDEMRNATYAQIPYFCRILKSMKRKMDAIMYTWKPLLWIWKLFVKKLI